MDRDGLRAGFPVQIVSFTGLGKMYSLGTYKIADGLCNISELSRSSEMDSISDYFCSHITQNLSVHQIPR